MIKFVDAVTLLICGLILLVSMSSFEMAVIIFLCGLIVGCLSFYFKKRIYVSILLLLYMLLILIDPAFVVFMPLILYVALYFEFKWEIVANVFFCLYGLSKLSTFQSAYTLCFMVLAVSLYIKTSKCENLDYKLKELRDTSVELNTALKNKNKDLMEKQDYEINLATLSERNRIAREIHDNVGHMLSRSILQIGALLSINKDPQVQEFLVSIKDTLNTAMTNIRESVHDLHDKSIDMRKAIYDATSAMTDYKINIDYDASNEVPRNIKYCFITTVKEAMNNIIKHSDASIINITLREHPGFYQLLIEDDGHVKNKSLLGGIGLDNMRDRVEAFDGTFRINTDNSFRIFISIPKPSNIKD